MSERRKALTDVTELPAVEIPDAGPESDGSRHARLEQATSRIRGTGGLSPERVFQLAGWVLPPVGIVLVLLSWYGTANTSRVWQQIPYLASGGMLGIAFIFTGGLAYLATWLTKLVHETGAQAAAAAAAAERTAAALERIEAALRANGSGGAGRPRLVATATGSMVHLPDCPMVEGRENLRAVRRIEPGMRPCLVCQPPIPDRSGAN